MLATLDPLAGMAATAKDALEALLGDLSAAGVGDAALLDEIARGEGLTGMLKDGLTDPDAVPEAPEARTKRGDIWLLGDHRIMCGDSTNVEDVARLMAGKTADALFTDPPYGIDRDPAWLDGVGTHRRALSSRDKLAGDDGTLDLSFLWQFPQRMVWGFPYILDPESTGWVVWDKQPGVGTRGIVTPIEMASTTLRKGFDMVRCMWGGYYRASGEERQPHPTQKPVAVIAPFVESWTQEGERIYDPFLGSGTTMIAAERLGRHCYGMEIAEQYCDVAVRRWEEFTGREAVRDG